MSLKTNQRYKAAIIFLIPFLVVIASTALFYSGASPEGRTNNGQLIDPPIDLSELSIEGLKDGFPEKWIIMHFLKGPCELDCWKSLYKTRQVNVLLGRDRQRLSRYLVLSNFDNLSESDLIKLSSEYPNLKIRQIDRQNLPVEFFVDEINGSYLLFDPLGNGILFYNSKLPGGELLEDLKKLLKNSKIG